MGNVNNGRYKQWAARVARPWATVGSCGRVVGGSGRHGGRHNCERVLDKGPRGWRDYGRVDGGSGTKACRRCGIT